MKGFPIYIFLLTLPMYRERVRFCLREERRRRIAAGEDNLVIHRGKIVDQVARQESSDH